MPIAALIVALVVCAYESLLKGWYSLMLIPFFLIAAPVTIYLQIATNRANKLSYSRKLHVLQIVQLVSLVMLFVFTVGFGDTNEVLLFGFYETLDSSLITQISTVLAGVGYIGALASSAILLIKIVTNWLRRRAK
jgi:hypothetical protein